MKRQAESTSETTKVVAAPPGATGEAHTPWGKPEKRHDTPAPPPVWTRYIDSRLKQFCAR